MDRLQSLEEFVAERTGEWTLPRHPARILVVEDDPELRALMLLALRQDGYEVVEAADGDQALEYLGSVTSSSEEFAPPDLVVSDIRMPGYSGLEMLESMRRNGNNVPVVIITGVTDSRTHAQAKRLGAAAVLDKPIDLADLRALVLDIVESD